MTIVLLRLSLIQAGCCRRALSGFPGLVLAAVFALSGQKSVSADPNTALRNAPNADTRQAEQVQHRLKWNLETLPAAYERYGRRDAKWDESVKAGLIALAEKSVCDPSKIKEQMAKSSDAINRAVANGCDDPLVRYAYVVYGMLNEKPTPAERTKAYRDAAEGLRQSQYPPIRKFYGALWAAWSLTEGTNIPPDAYYWRGQATNYLVQAISDPAMPPAEVYQACDAVLQPLQNDKVAFEQCYHAIEPLIFKSWSSEASLYLLKGTFYLKDAWHARGSGYADTVTDEGSRLFTERLAEAEKALTKGWELNPRDERIARQMMRVELGQGNGRARMETWFKRAVDLNPNYYEAFQSKLYYLEPKWHGSTEEMLKFGRECVRSDQWGGRVPLILMEAHESLVKYLDPQYQADYWKRPEVWKDIKAALKKFSRLNPEDITWRQHYVRYAYRAEQWDDLNQQLPLLGSINYQFFGGQAQFDNMVRLAKEHARSRATLGSRMGAINQP